nr:ecdysteroid UDP-glucosyltransferase [Darna trima granulovirus]
MLLYCCLLFVVVHIVMSANILCVFPTPAHSHQSVFNVYTDALARDGHNVTVITPTPRNVHYLTEIVCRTTFDNLIQRNTTNKKRGIIADESTVTYKNYTPFIDMIVSQLSGKNVSSMLANKNNRFDLIVCEAYLSVNLVFGYIYSAPILWLSSGHGTNNNFDTLNNNTIIYDYKSYPNIWRSNFNTTTSGDSEKILQREWMLLDNYQHKLLQKNFNVSASMMDLKNRVVFMLINVYRIMDGNRPVGPNIQYLGGLHLKSPIDVSTVDDDLHKFIASSIKIVYVSFGSIADVSLADSDFKIELLRIFSSIPYNVLWRNNNVSQVITTRSNTIMTRKWFPQRWILKQNNIKLFITQCGIQSIDEAIDSGVPILCIPIAGDQFVNSQRIKSLGLGTTVNAYKLETENVDKIIINMVEENKYYTNRLIFIKKIINDEPQNVDIKAVWYTNKILRYIDNY